MMLERARAKGRDLQRDELRRLPYAERERLRLEVVASLPEDCILDVHLSVRTVTGLEHALPRDLAVRRLGAVVILWASPFVVMQRRAGRHDRNNPQDSQVALEQQQAFNLQIAKVLNCDRLVLIDAGRSIDEVAADLQTVFVY